MKILYFTGSGNSLSVAKRFDAEYLSIPQMIKNNIYEIEDDVIGIIYPVYAASIPDIVRKYLTKCTLKAGYIFVIATYGSIACGTLHEMKKILSVSGNKADYYNSILMVDNYLPFFDIETQLAKIKDKNIEYNLTKIVDEIKERVKKDENCSLIDKFVSAIGYTVVRQIEKFTPKMFYVNEECVSCGICKKVCPVSNVEQDAQNKPVFGNNCEGCLSCIHNCPKNAIQMKGQRSEKRFRNPEVSLNEIINSNN